MTEKWLIFQFPMHGSSSVAKMLIISIFSLRRWILKSPKTFKIHKTFPQTHFKIWNSNEFQFSVFSFPTFIPSKDLPKKTLNIMSQLNSVITPIAIKFVNRNSNNSITSEEHFSKITFVCWKTFLLYSVIITFITTN